MTIHIDSCAARETIVASTRSSVYEVIVLRGDEGDVLVRGGRHFTEFRRVLFLGSTADSGALEPRTIDIGLRMKFVVGDRLGHHLRRSSRSSRRPASTASTECAQHPNEPGVHRDSHGSPTVLTGTS